MSTDNAGSRTTKFDLLEGADGRQFLYIFTGRTAFTLELTGNDRNRLLTRLEAPPRPINRGDRADN